MRGHRSQERKPNEAAGKAFNGKDNCSCCVWAAGVMLLCKISQPKRAHSIAFIEVIRGGGAGGVGGRACLWKTGVETVICRVEQSTFAPAHCHAMPYYYASPK